MHIPNSMSFQINIVNYPQKMEEVLRSVFKMGVIYVFTCANFSKRQIHVKMDSSVSSHWRLSAETMLHAPTKNTSQLVGGGIICKNISKE